VGFAAGIALWFQLPAPAHWLALICLCGAFTTGSLGLLQREGRFPYLRLAIASMALAVAAGCLTVWAKSTLVGAPALSRPVTTTLLGRVLQRQDQPAEAQVRLVLATREPETGRAIRVRMNVPIENDNERATEGALVRLRARLMPPPAAMLPGSYNFARAAWFEGLAATGSVFDPVQVVEPANTRNGLARLQRALSNHIHRQLDGTPGGIAAAFASGDRGGISEADETAMRDAGLTHLLSVSGLHVGAVIAAAYFLAMALLGMWPWLALRVRLPVVASAVGAGTGMFYTLLTGAEVPTIRSCAGAILVMLALALGREPLSLRLLAIAALLVMALWPEAVIGPGFQMSFASVLAIVALHGAQPTRDFLAARDEEWWRRAARNLVMLMATGIVIEIALMPIALYHFHRAGIYGALANTIAIPLTTFATMPLIGMALLFDAAGAGAPFWWLAGKSIELLLAIAHWTAARPGAVNHLPAMGAWRFALFLCGAFWLALWRGKIRLWGLLPAGIAAISLLLLRPPDLLISGDGRHAGITGETDGKLIVLRDGRASYARENLTELAGMAGETITLADWPGAQCSRDFCAIELLRGDRRWQLLLARGMDPVPERALAAACERSDIVIAARWLPYSCKPRWLKADRTMLERTGGLAIYLDEPRVVTVAQGEGRHGWWTGDRKSPFIPSASKQNAEFPTPAASPVSREAGLRPREQAAGSNSPPP